MKIKFKIFFHVLAVISFVNFSLAKNEQQSRKRPTLITESATSHENVNDERFEDQIALESFPKSVKNNFPEDFPNYPYTAYTASEEFRKSLKKHQKPIEKVHYITAEPYLESFSQDYVHHALKTHSEKSNKEKSSNPTQQSAATFGEYSTHARDDLKKTFTSKRKKVNHSENDDDYSKNIFHESKRIFTRTNSSKTTTTTMPTFYDDTEKFYRPQSSDAVIKKELTTHNNNGDEVIENIHYYYPEKTVEDVAPAVFPSSTTSTPTIPSRFSDNWITKKPKTKSPINKKKLHTAVNLEHTSTDPYQFQPVIPRPSEYATFENFVPSISSFDFPSSTIKPISTASPKNNLKPTKKINNFYLPTSTISPSTTMTPRRNKKPSSTLPPLRKYANPSTTTATHFSTTKAPDYFKYSTPTTPAPSKLHESFYIQPSSSSTPSSALVKDFDLEESRDDVVLIKPKSQFINVDTMKAEQPTENVKETVIYRFVPEFHTINSTTSNENSDFFYRNFNESSLNDEEEFLRNFHQNYNFEHFTEKDAGPLPTHDNHGFDDHQRADKKAMIVQISNDGSDYSLPSSPNPYDIINDREIPPGFDDENDHQAEASQNQYLFLYSLDEEERKKGKHSGRVKKPKEPENFYHYHSHRHQHDHDADESELEHEFDSEFDSELLHSDNVRIVDPSVRGGKPLEFTKDDYLRHIKQAVVQYMKEHHKDSLGSMKVKAQDSNASNKPVKAALRSQTLSSQQYKPLSQMKLPKNVFTAGQLKEAIEELRESPQIDFTTKRPKAKPIDLSALDVGQSYQHVSQFDHSAVLKNVEGFDQSNVVAKPKLQLNQQSYQDINNLRKPQNDADDEDFKAKLFKGYRLPKINNNQEQNSYSSMSYDGSKLPRIRGGNQDDDDDDDDKVNDPVDAPIQIINGIPVANPYNIDLNTLKYMLGGIAQAEVNDQLKDLDGSSSNQQFRYPQNWKSFSSQFNQQQQQPASIYPVFNPQQQQQKERRQKKNPSQNFDSSKFPLLGQLQSYNNKNKKNQKNQQRNPGISDYSSWNSNKKHRSEPQMAASNQNKIFIRPVMKNKQARDELLPKFKMPRIRQLSPATEMRPPPIVTPPKTHLIVKKVI